MTTTTEQLHVRSFHVRSFDTATREFVGIGVPWDTPVAIRDWDGVYTEQFARGAVAVPESGKVLLCWRHNDPIGRLVSYADTDEGWEIRGRISQTPLGDDAYTLLRDDVVTELSIGFTPVEHSEDESGEVRAITRTKVIAVEVSLVPRGAYGSHAQVSEVRHATNSERNTAMSGTVTDEDVSTRLDCLEEQQRSFTALISRFEDPDDAAGDTRSAAAFVKALAAGEESALESYKRSLEHLFSEEQHRAYTGGTTADAPVKDAWVGDLTRIFDASSGVLSDFFSTGTLPATGNNIEFAELGTNTTQVTEQVAEGNDLAYGKVTLTTRTAPVKTYGGYVQLTRQQIERSTLPVLNRSLEALSKAAGARKKAVLRAAYGTLVAARVGVAANAGVVVLGATLGASAAQHWLDTIINGAVRFDENDLSMDGAIVSPSVFKKLNSLETTGHRIFEIVSKADDGRAVGRLDLTKLTGDLSGVLVVCDPGQGTDQAVLANREALRQYDSAVVSLQDENIINLSKDFSVYRYGAVAAEIPGGVLPIKLAAA